MLFLLINGNQIFACQEKTDFLKFSGKLISTDREKRDWILYVGYNRADNFDATGATITFHPKVDSVGNFQFTLPNLGKPYQFTLGVFQTENEGLGKRKLFSNVFFAEPGDDTKIDIILELNDAKTEAMNTVIFSGIGAEKYNLAWQLQNSFFKDYLRDIERLGLQKSMDSIAIKDKMQQLASVLRHYKSKKSNLIYSTSISPEMSQIINYEYGAYEKGLNSEWRFRSQLLYDKYPQYRKQIARDYLMYKEIFYKKPNPIAKYCCSYIEELLIAEIFEHRIRTGSYALNIETMYNVIKTKYLGVVRERILGLILTNTRIQGYFSQIENSLKDSLLNDGLRLARIPYIKKTFQEKIIELNNLNSKIFNGEFSDPEGNKFELKSLAGKVILLDVWFNGCWGCAEFHKAFEKVYPKFKNNKNFVVLSVNVDKDKERWIKGIQSKLYTADDYIQVTTGNWFDHPFMKYYNIQGASYVMVIDQNGKILPKSTTIMELCDQISEALGNNKRKSSK